MPEMSVLLNVIDGVRAAKTNAQIALKTELFVLSINNLDAEKQNIIKQNKTLLQGVTKAQSIEFDTQPNGMHENNETYSLGIKI